MSSPVSLSDKQRGFAAVNGLVHVLLARAQCVIDAIIVATRSASPGADLVKSTFQEVAGPATQPVTVWLLDGLQRNNNQIRKYSLEYKTTQPVIDLGLLNKILILGKS